MTGTRDADRANSGREREVGGARVRTAGIIVVGFALIVLTVFLTYCAVVFWPPSASGTGGQPAPAPESMRLLWWTVDAPSRETSLFLVVLTAGGIGGCIHSLRSLYWYVGNRNLRYSWLLMYFMLPLVGAMMALVTYVVLRGGLTTAVVGPEGVNPFGVAAVSALVGLFSREATEKLRIIFETVLTSAEKGKDQALPAEIRAVTPPEGPPGTTVTVTGAGLTDASEVRFGAAVAQPHVASDTHLTVAVPADATTGPITVVTPAGVAQSPKDFILLPLPPSPEAESATAMEEPVATTTRTGASTTTEAGAATTAEPAAVSVTDGDAADGTPDAERAR